MRRAGASTALALALAGVLVTPGPSLAATPIDGGPITLLPRSINTSAGDQYDPHVSGDIAAYTSDNNIRYYDFLLNTDVQVPAPANAQDLLSDVDGGRIAFSRIGGYGTNVEVFDIATATTTEVDPHDAAIRFKAAIGGSTVAFIDYGAAPEGELFAGTIGGPMTRITTDSRTDENQAVSPTGDSIVYDSCRSAGCEVRQATLSGPSWVVTTLVPESAVPHFPDTDGSVVVYDDTRAGEQDIFWQPVGGGPEHRLEMPGDQVDPSVSGGLILFPSTPPGEQAADLYLYQISTNRLFRVTSTQGVNESLVDISVLPDGQARIVWSSGEEGQRDVLGATVELPPAGPAYHFGGFRQPVDALPTINQMKAGGAVPVKFSLGGDQGLSIFAAGYPKSQLIACDATATVAGIETTVSAGGSSLSYDPLSDTYTYVWKTDKSWAGTCRQLVLSFVDGSVQRATFSFK
jgi:hypothetical protein